MEEVRAIPAAVEVSVSAATNKLNKSAEQFATGNAPTTINVNGVEMKGGKTGQYTSNGGFVVNTFKYTAENAINSDGSNSITFNATEYKTRNGEKADTYKRRKPRVFNVKTVGASAYSYGTSGGIR